ncbi:hypothetical protein DEA8626_02446 [Defluviimonas aquaemixtae]|uniref:Uncharacterized protein n=1 Tax=Albidovulum aquaemixtae TaxID=1542388 RepID=A0A2R8BJ42_9RHOB|nr:hypothetical protein [Defluviimonas aquaemixtae]SPH23382.1 hypothetical protein DEA8626_02446 [Defluviimonas aquaemixtae]
MPDQPEAAPVSETRAEFGMYTRPAPEPAIAPADVVAGVASVLWLALIGGFFLFSGDGEGSGGALSSVLVLVAIFLPIALIWIAALTLRTARAVRSETERLQSAIDAMRYAYVSQAQAGLNKITVEKRLDEIAASARQTENAIVTFTTSRDTGHVQPSADRKAALAAPKPADPEEEQPALALGTPAEALAQPVSIADFIRALNFPDNANDTEGFRALRRALNDRALAKLIRAAQDALTLLSQDGIYMDDLRPDRARPELWRRFAQGERGRQFGALGGVRDRSSLALTAARMRQDTIFRDTAHHFLRQFDKTFSEFEKNATDAEIVELTETRTARAFMLLGRVTGIFD